MTTKTIKTPRATQAKKPDANRNGQASAKPKPQLEELSLKAYRLTHERLYGKHKAQPKSKLPRAA